jgi:hypothetical protein
MHTSVLLYYILIRTFHSQTKLCYDAMISNYVNYKVRKRQITIAFLALSLVCNKSAAYQTNEKL